MLLKRFYCPNLTDLSLLTLDAKEAHHAGSVLRLKKGDKVEVFDGRGSHSPCTITALSKKEITLNRGEVNRSQIAPFSIHVALSVPHRGKLDDITEKCEELGVSKLILVKSERTVFDFKKDTFEKLIGRLRRVIVESAKQSRNDFLMEVEGWVESRKISDQFSHYEKVFLMSTDTVPGQNFEEVDHSKKKPFLILIGPEGGWTNEEEACFCKKGAHSLSLGKNILRCETATVAAVARLQNELEKLKYGN